MKKDLDLPYFDFAERRSRGEKIPFTEVRRALILEAFWIDNFFVGKIFSLSTLAEHLKGFESLQTLLWEIKSENTEAWALTKKIAQISHNGYNLDGLKRVVALLIEINSKIEDSTHGDDDPPLAA